MSLESFEGYLREPCFPRVSGDEPGFESFRQSVETFSPRERG